MLRRLIGFLQNNLVIETLEPGEIEVSLALRKLDTGSYRLLNNLLLPSTGNTTHTQIDHVVVSRYGIFCIETKSQHGIIFGSRDRKYWTHCSYGAKYKLYNPLWQNYLHIKSLEQVLPGSLLKVSPLSFVVFPYAYKLNVDNSAVLNSIEGLISAIEKHQISHYSDEEIENIYQILKLANIKDHEVMAKHIQEVNALTLAN